MSIAYAVLGLGAGALQARSLSRSRAPWLLLVRLLGVALALSVSALAGQLLSAAAGWACGFVVGSAVALRKLR
jgi:hypothetical protein